MFNQGHSKIGIACVAVAGFTFSEVASSYGQEAELPSTAIAANAVSTEVSNRPSVKTPELQDQFVLIQSYDDLRRLAAKQAKLPYRPEEQLNEELAKLDYDEYIKIKYRHERATWSEQGLPFWIETFHRGFVQRDRVDLFTLTPIPHEDNGEGNENAKVCQRVNFSCDDFTYPKSVDVSAIGNAGHAGIRLVGRFPGLEAPEEILSFLGSSYFRGRSETTIYGSSARGLAINVAMQQEEEFPDFRAFWVEMPASDDESVSVLGYLDSPSVCGAYRFVLQPGIAKSDVEIQCELHFREVPDKVAIAPLTSMWMWGDGLNGPPLDSRPAVHDSDGLLIWKGGENWRWRPYARQSYPSVTSVHVDELHGFGTLQRNRAFFHYDDHNARYDKRPSVWVTPKTPWTNGHIELLELPGAHEGVDNIGAYWIPDQPIDVSEPLDFEYTVSFFAGDPEIERCVAKATNLSVTRSEGLAEIEIRFAGDAIKDLPDDRTLEVQTAAIRGKVTSQSIRPTETGDWVLTSIVDPDETGPVELSWTLVHDGKVVSEEVAYLLPDKATTFTYPAVYTRQE
ncbi:glucan biosynthesis protein [Rhodopirellula sp. MGV]|uniref:glucan biosynthesis protein n=1 Tax=Rhodopirellula sp. MGV TaxID=2023130 RepID=UPI000B96627B|nr:glucan biosynthesis protein [Rhodopirellula sp. MGV]OYP33924.1 hypothetical protein CGZ80_17215 [Rhodopirellula sp. MGV]PNY34094.1 glucan biosynthesis protein G [Rhodopirellula baltica]